MILPVCELKKPFLGLINFDHVTSISLNANPSKSPFVEVEVKFILSDNELKTVEEELKKYRLTEI